METHQFKRPQRGNGQFPKMFLFTFPTAGRPAGWSVLPRDNDLESFNPM